MKKEKWIEILILICLFAVLIGGGLLFRHYKIVKPNTYNIVFKDIDLVVKGSPVRFMGLNIGYVSKLKRKDGYIICKIRVTKEDVKIPPGTRAKIEFNGLGGSKSVELFPPDTNNPVIGGIIAMESMRINDLGGVFEYLKDVCIIINNMVQEFDSNAFLVSVRSALNPEVINRIDGDMEKIIKKTNETKKHTGIFNEKGNSLNTFIENSTKAFNEFFNGFIKK